MTALKMMMKAPAPATPACRRRGTRGFTLTELLVVIALIVLLVSVLLAALAGVRRKAQATQTEATMQAFINACSIFQQEHGFLPGVVPEDILASDPQISGTENALLHLMGGYVTEQEVGTTAFEDTNIYPDATASGCYRNGWYRIDFGNGATTFSIKVNIALMGNGPVINGKPFPPYFTPDDRSFHAVTGSTTDGAVSGHPALETCSGDDPDDEGNFHLPDLADAWGQPIIYVRRSRTIGQLATGQDSPPYAQFDLRSANPYIRTTGLGEVEANQNLLSMLNESASSDYVANFARLLEHPSIPGQAKGAFMLLSAGADGVYFATIDGPGDPASPVFDISDAALYPASVIGEYDDLLRFGGS